MVPHMKTTVEIEDHLFERAKREALRRKTTLRRLIEEGLRAELARGKSNAKRYVMRDVSVGGGLLPGVGPWNWFELSERPWTGPTL
jgi:hypothetical protein